GNFESEKYEPNEFKPLQPHPGFRARTDRDGYWGAKIVSSFTDAQIRAAVEAAGYEDPRATEFLVRRLIERRDKTARYWFGRVAPLDFFSVRDGRLHFHDLAVDRGLVPARSYRARVRSLDGPGYDRQVTLTEAALPFSELAPHAARVRLVLTVQG